MLIITGFARQIESLCKRGHIYIAKRFVAENKWLKRKMANEKLPAHRADPVIKSVLNNSEFRSFFSPELTILADMFKKYNYEIRIAGGAVRDILMDVHPNDLDFATTATPEQMKEMFTKEEVRMINTNGEKHGTVTARINDKENFEITTLRIDVATDGRHAEVVFTTDWLLDASRRDLTVNSLFLGLDGKVYDYFYGYDDLLKRRIAFVGEPAQRICEDYLRILRYFRFYGRISDKPDNHDEKIIQAIKDNVSGLERVSGERIWSEWSKVLMGNFHRELTRKIIECRCAKYIGLPEYMNFAHFDEVCLTAQRNKLRLRAVSLVAALLNNEEDVMKLFMRLKFTNFERNLAMFIVTNREDKPCANPLKPYQRLVLRSISKVSDAREYVAELLRYKGALKLLEDFEKWKVKFPITGYMVQPHLENKRLTGEVLLKLKDIWLDSNCEMPTEKLQSYIPELAEEAALEYKEKMERMGKVVTQKGKKNSTSN